MIEFPTAPRSLRYRHEYAVGFPRSLPGSSCPPPREFPAITRRVRTAPSPDPPGFELVSHKGTVTRRFLAYSSPTRSPDPNHLAVLARPGFVGAAPTLPGTTRSTAAPSSTVLLRRDQRRSLTPLETQRLTAHTRLTTLGSLRPAAAAHKVPAVGSCERRNRQGAACSV